MNPRLSGLVVVCLVAIAGVAAELSASSPMTPRTATVCPADPGDSHGPDWADARCETVKLYDVDPQGQAIWLAMTITLDDIATLSAEPLAVRIAGKMATDVYLNGSYIGANGTPGATRQAEVPGQMDAAIYIPPTALARGENTLVLRASSLHGFLHLAHPVHDISIGPAIDPQRQLLDHYWPSLPTMGVFFIAGLYLLVATVLTHPRMPSALLVAMCIFAGGQLITEVSRALFAYPYPFHDVRLLLIVLFSAGFGISSAMHVFRIFVPTRFWPLTGAAIVASVIGIAVQTGFDQKAVSAMLAPMALSVIVLAMRWHRGNRRARRYCLIMTAFLAASLGFLSSFLDVVFFYSVATFLTVLLVERAITAAETAARRRAAERRASQLELALEQALQAEQRVVVAIKSAGKIDRVASDQIVQVKGAGSFVEVITTDGRKLLHATPLANMESLLPTTFIRVHRSHLVNTRFVKSLRRTAQGNGALTLTDETEVPVSRRIMPSVRRAFA